jgi:hypothetical protein
MSGPIVRKYGFPNFDNIFGERPLQHGVDESDEAAPEAEKKPKAPAKKPSAAKPAAKPRKKSGA